MTTWAKMTDEQRCDVRRRAKEWSRRRTRDRRNARQIAMNIAYLKKRGYPGY